MAGKQPGTTSKEPSEIVFDRALEVNGLAGREDGESVAEYLGRKDFGPNARSYLALAWEGAQRLDQVTATAAAYSARLHFDNPNPPDSKPLKP